MKKAVAISLFIFWTVLVALLSAGLTEKYGQRNRLRQGQETPGLRLDSAEVGKHATENDCWMIIEGKVYDLTASISKHPGGAGEIVRFCGKDGSSAFKTKGKEGGRDHSINAYEMLKEYYLGEAGDVMSGSGLASSTPVSKNDAATTSAPASAPTSKLTLSMSEVAKHNKASDCWFVINQKVYNVTKAISDHPGGASTIIKYCGQEATKAFATKDYGSDHSASAYDMLKAYYIGDIGRQVDAAKTAPAAPSQSKPTVSQPPAVVKPAGNITLTAAEVAKHKSATDCWMIVSNKVYSLASYISSHPGGSNNIIRFCGQDGTTAFATKGSPGGSNHSGSAYALLVNYFIGDLGQVLSGTQLDAKINQVQAQPAPQGGENESEQEDD